MLIYSCSCSSLLIPPCPLSQPLAGRIEWTVQWQWVHKYSRRTGHTVQTSVPPGVDTWIGRRAFLLRWFPIRLSAQFLSRQRQDFSPLSLVSLIKKLNCSESLTNGIDQAGRGRWQKAASGSIPCLTLKMSSLSLGTVCLTKSTQFVYNCAYCSSVKERE